jgi:hypothetical protein
MGISIRQKGGRGNSLAALIAALLKYLLTILSHALYNNIYIHIKYDMMAVIPPHKFGGYVYEKPGC